MFEKLSLLLLFLLIAYLIAQQIIARKAIKAEKNFETEQIDRPLRDAFETSETNPIRRAQIFFRAVDDAMSHAPSSCSNKCSHCCYQAIDIYPYEVPAIADYINRLSQEDKVYIKHHATIWASKYVEHVTQMKKKWDILKTTDDNLQKGVLNKTTYWQLADDYSDLQPMCPFLKDQSCMIYPARPVMCRNFVITESPDLCAEDHMQTRSYASHYINIQTKRHLRSSGEDMPFLHLLKDAIGLEVDIIKELKS